MAFSAALSAGAQENKFLYLQTEDGQPFYVKAGGVHHSSTISGFLILSKLQDTSLELVLGFPRDIYPAQNFRLASLERDRGMVLKRREDGQWVLVDLHTLDVTPGSEIVKDAPARRQSLTPATSDSFTTVLSSVISDSTLLETKVAPGRDAGNPAAATPPSSSAKPASLGSKVDTIKTVQARGADEAAMAPNPSLSVRVANSDSTITTVKQASNAVPQESEKVQAVPAAMQDRNDCRSVESVKQLGDLRRRMESIRDEEAKVAEAVREMRLRCLTTVQVRSLLVVFDREEGRYKMLDAAYPLVQDPSSYPALLPVLKDPYFIHRFKRLTGMPLE